LPKRFAGKRQSKRGRKPGATPTHLQLFLHFRSADIIASVARMATVFCVFSRGES